MWINSLRIPRRVPSDRRAQSEADNEAIHVANLLAECKDGLLLLRVLNYLFPGSVDWKIITPFPRNRFQVVANNNEVFRVCKEVVGLELVNNSGLDLADGSRKLTLAISECGGWLCL